jgi:hypothetical protein
LVTTLGLGCIVRDADDPHSELLKRYGLCGMEDAGLTPEDAWAGLGVRHGKTAAG